MPFITKLNDTMTYHYIWKIRKNASIGPSAHRIKGSLPEVVIQDFFITDMKEIEHVNDIIYIGRPVFEFRQVNIKPFKLVDCGKYALQICVMLGKSSISETEHMKGLV